MVNDFQTLHSICIKDNIAIVAINFELIFNHKYFDEMNKRNCNQFNFNFDLCIEGIGEA